MIKLLVSLQAKIAKRGRKLIDYDVARHNVDTMTAKRVEEVKLSKVVLPAYSRSPIVAFC